MLRPGTPDGIRTHDLQRCFSPRITLLPVGILLTVNFEDGFDDYYIIARDISLSQLHLQPEEVMDARWATLEEVCAMIDSGEFIPFMKSFIAFLFEMRNGVDNLNT